MILRRVLVANRGEIAVRVMRTCRRLGIETVLAVSAADADSVPARLADKTIEITSYLDVEAVVAAAVAAEADAIHPGYGFLFENPRLARACEAADVVFIGPGAEVLEAAGDKLAARAPRGRGRAAGAARGACGGWGWWVGWRRGGRGAGAGACRGDGGAGPRRGGGGAGPRCGSGQAGRADRVSGAGQGGWCATLVSSPGRSRWPARRRRRRSPIRGCTWSGTSPPRGTSRCRCSATGGT